MSEAIVSLRNVVKHYNARANRMWKSCRTDPRYSQGDFVALMGPSGSGRPRWLNLIDGLVRRTRAK